MLRSIITLFLFSYSLTLFANIDHFGKYQLVDNSSKEVLGSIFLKENHTFSIRYKSQNSNFDYLNSENPVFRIAFTTTSSKVISLNPSIRPSSFKQYLQSRFEIYQKDKNVYITPMTSVSFYAYYFIKNV